MVITYRCYVMHNEQYCNYSDRAPSIIKLYANLPNPGFSDAEETEPGQKLVFEPGKLLLPDDRIPLKIAKFQNVNRFLYLLILI